ncbi:30S ribosomal protein S2 [Candidatus Azoamicus ciliaticola]|uniref:Small ribosomal subunit protein uS2 n=1 Tax=Candidatus Azoamicus ciliaticola TaxID=2652803 RepID=A0A6J5JXZ8_9GAMM|nr:30S ribosomal protein S2 [Candidatus Azoamicus ciliaticola]CAB3976461.1 30S ribosomal protein S2 [Candidatus Azoamicus ciliaticola]
MNNIPISDLFNSKVHFGHLKRFVSPKMFKYIYCMNNKISIINLDLTLKMLNEALVFVGNVIKNNGVILFVGTKKQARKLIKEYAEKMNMPYVNFRWLGGLLTNYKTIKNSIDKLKELEIKLSSNNENKFTKKEGLILNRKLNKLKLSLEGIRNMDKLPDVLFIIDVNYESIALLEANRLSIPVIGIVDTNSNPDLVTYVIPGNDDSTDAIKFYLETFYNFIIFSKKI